MKKLMGISLVAMLAVAPFAANATAVAGSPTVYSTQPEGDAKAAVLGGTPLYQLVEANPTTDVNAASAGYVKGAYNAAIKGINKVHDEVASITNNALTTAGDGLAKDGNTVSVDMTTNGGLELSGETNGSKTLGVKVGDGIKVGSNGVEVDLTSNKGLQVDATNHTLEVKAGNGIDLDSTGVKVKAKTSGGITVDGDGVSLTNGIQNASNTATYSGTGLTTKGYVDEAVAGLNIGDYATKTGVENTIKSTTLTSTVGEFTLTSGTVSGTVTVPIMDDWTNPDTPASTELAATTSLSVGTDITEGSVTTTVDTASVDYATANTTQG